MITICDSNTFNLKTSLWTDWDSPCRLHYPIHELVFQLFHLQSQRDLHRLEFFGQKILLSESVTWSVRFSVVYESHFLQFFAKQVEHWKMQEAFLEKFWDFDVTLLRLRKPNRKMFHLNKIFFERSKLFKYTRYFEMAQKCIKGGMNHVKSYAFDLEIAQLQNGSKSRSYAFILRWLIS